MNRKSSALGLCIALGLGLHVPTSPKTVDPSLYRARTKQAGGRGAARLPRPVRGSLAAGDARLQSGEFVDRHSITLPVGARVRIGMTSRAFDTYLIVRGPNGDETQNDDASNTDRNASIDVVVSGNGVYTILATSYAAGESGAYQLTFAPSPAGAQPTEARQGSASAPSPPPSGGGDVRRGSLAPGDSTLTSGEFYDQVTQQVARAGGSLTLRLASSAFDPYLIVRTPSGNQLDNDDASPGDTNAALTIPSTEAGTYTIVVTSYRAGETGDYTLSIDAGAAVATPTIPTTPTVPSTPTSTITPVPSGGGHLRGVFAGISDYPGTNNDLDDCADDAVKLAQSMQRAGLMTSAQQTVLTDAQVTRGAIREALTRMARDAAPDDVILFFYSGHGSQSEGSRDPREIDGIDESIFLYDGEMVDDEMGTLFDAFGPRLAVLALDSCFAGGFAKDVVTRPNRIGLFSSEEDVESGVASQFQAGGYLSYYLRLGAVGAADTSPRDRRLTVGELEHYLLVEFNRNASNLIMDGAFQHFVVDRGAVHGDQVLWNVPAQ